MTSAVVCVAMDAEASPFMRLARKQGTIRRIGGAGFVHLDLDGHDVLLIRSGIGQTNAAAALTAAIVADAAAASLDTPAPWSIGGGKFAPRIVVSAGTAGGLGRDVQVDDVVIGAEATYSMANAVAFGYEYGQIPGMPRSYHSDEATVAAAATAQLAVGKIHTGLIVSQDAFVNAPTAYDIRGQFSDVLATDMETTALAQVAYNFGVPFIAIRGISDLCGPEAGTDHRSNADGAARASADVVLAMLSGLQ